MKLGDTDTQTLKSLDVLQTYAESRLDGRAMGRVFRCACPWGTHNDSLKVEITEYNGEGRATCWSCGKNSVNIFELASAVSGIPNDKEHFAELKTHVAEVTGYHLTAAPPPLRRNDKKKRATTLQRTTHLQGGATARTDTTSPAEDTPRPWVDDTTEQLAWEAVERAARNPEKLAMLAADLGLPARALTFHADLECHAHGLIGLSPNGLLLFISTRTIFSGKLKVTAIKARAPKHGTAPAEVIEDGRWVVRGTLDADRKGGKFRACVTGTGTHLWGEDAIADHDAVIISEGESDKLAIDYAVDTYREAWQTGLDERSEHVPEHSLPAVVACAGARVFKREWARLFRGKVVYICGDDDKAGREGLMHTAALLQADGVENVRIWTPRHGYKDARQQFHASRPAELMEDIISRAEPLAQKRRYEYD